MVAVAARHRMKNDTDNTNDADNTSNADNMRGNRS